MGKRIGTEDTLWLFVMPDGFVDVVFRGPSGQQRFMVGTWNQVLSVIAPTCRVRVRAVPA